MHDPEYGHEHAHHTEHSREEALAVNAEIKKAVMDLIEAVE